MTRGEKNSPSPPHVVARPFKPRPVLFFVLLVVTLLWIAALVAMYVATRGGAN